MSSKVILEKYLTFIFCSLNFPFGSTVCSHEHGERQVSKDAGSSESFAAGMPLVLH